MSLNRLLLFMLLVLPFGVLAQMAVTGRVTDAQNNPLVGATVSVRSTNTSVQTNQDGVFTINVPNANAKLVISYVGFGSKTVDASGDLRNITLEEDRTNLSEVVVTGLATSTKRANSAHSNASISAKQLAGNTRPQTVDAALQGKVAGAQITATNGAPGGGFAVRLRGVSSINLSSEPLYIIDGVYMNNSQFGSGAGTAPFSGASTVGTSSTQDQTPNRLADLNPADIENIEILKGPSAAAIYGTRANAGVIIITTKRGKAGKTNISFGQDVGVSSALNLLGLHKSKWDQQFVAAPNAAAHRTRKAQYNPGDETWDYEDIIFGNTGFIRNTRLSATGGTDKIRFYAGGNLWDETGIMKRTGYSRSSVRLNLDIKPSNWWDISVATNYTNSKSDRGFTGNNNNGVAVGYSIAYLPNWLPQLPDDKGNYPVNPYTGQNIFQIIDKAVNNEEVNRYIVSFNNTFNLLRKENHSLKLQAQGGLDYILQENLVFMPEELQYQRARPNPGAVRYSNIRNRNINMQAFLVDNLQVKDFSFTTSAGMVRLEADNETLWSQGEGIPAGTTNPVNANVRISELDLSSWQDVGYVVQEEVNWGDKIIATGGIRWDKSSLNGYPNKLYAFPKASLAVNLSNFDFWNVPQVNLLKLRSAFGQTGNPASFGSKFNSLVPLVIDGVLGFTFPITQGNPIIEPETSQEIEFGLDFALFNNRVNGEFTVYNRVIKDFIDVFNLSPGTGVNSYRAYNVGDIQNRGVEVTLGGRVIRNNKVNWNTTFNWWRNRSEITRLDIPEKVTANSGFGAYGTQRLRLGNSPTQWYGTPNVNGLPTAYEDAQPKWQLSWSNNVSFLKNFEFSLLLHHSHKNYNSNLTHELTDAGGTSKDWSVLNKDGVPLGRTRVMSSPGATTRNFIQDATFTKLREASLYYTLPRTSYGNVAFLKNLEQIRVGISGNNIFTWTNYHGYDPEVANFGNRPTIASVDVMPYPSVRRLYFHLNVNF